MGFLFSICRFFVWARRRYLFILDEELDAILFRDRLVDLLLVYLRNRVEPDKRGRFFRVVLKRRFSYEASQAMNWIDRCLVREEKERHFSEKRKGWYQNPRRMSCETWLDFEDDFRAATEWVAFDLEIF